MNLLGVHQRLENVAPYALFGDEGGDFSPGVTLGAGVSYAVNDAAKSRGLPPVDPIRRISIRSRGMSKAAIRGRTHVSTRPSAQTKEEFSLASDGASTHVP